MNAYTIHTIHFTMYDRYVVQGPNGYIGRYDLNENMRDDMPEQLAGCFESTAAAEVAIKDLEARR